MKWSGKIGYRETVETQPGVWEEKITERKQYGDIIRYNRSLQSSDQINDNIRISNIISIIADPYANKNMYSIIYVEFMGVKWKVSTVDVAYPRLNLTLGDKYNG